MSIINIIVFLSVVAASGGCFAATVDINEKLLLHRGLTATELAVIVNESDPKSIEIGSYYAERRSIPPENIIRVNFPSGQSVLSPERFRMLYRRVLAQTPAHVQAYALTWAAPYRVGCMSITTAFAAGFDETFCGRGCTATKPNPYFNADSNQPFTDFGWRPTMAIAATSVGGAKKLIDRGVAADFSYPRGTAYLLRTSDKNRNVRSATYHQVINFFGKQFNVKVLDKDVLESRSDIMFYFTGLVKVERITSNTFRPGALADHLTSTGGQLTDSKQMSSLRWLEGGATASYGSVTEPCNFLQKFPHPGLVMFHYLRGDTAIEAYWKSVAWPGQGIFIGEPLAKPFGIL